MNKCNLLTVICAVSLFILAACDFAGQEYATADGGKVDNSFKAPKKIESRNIDYFKTHFYLVDTFNDANSGSYSFLIEKNEGGEYVLSENSHFNISTVIDADILEKLQLIIEENNLVEANGVDKHTSGLPEEYAPCLLSVVYDSGEELFFSEDNNPGAKWAFDTMELLKSEFIKQGHEELLPPIEDTTLVRFDMSYTDGERVYSYFTYFTEEDTDEYAHHYMKITYNRNDPDDEYNAIIEVPDDFYSDLAGKINELELENHQNGEIAPSGTSKMDKYAQFCMEMESGLQVNAFYEGEAADELYELLGELSEYLDSYF